MLSRHVLLYLILKKTRHGIILKDGLILDQRI